MTYRIQVVLDDQSRQDLSWLIANQNQSTSQLIRTLVVKEARAKKETGGKISALQALRQAAVRAKKLGPSPGPVDFALKHDQYLY